MCPRGGDLGFGAAPGPHTSHLPWPIADPLSAARREEEEEEKEEKWGRGEGQGWQAPLSHSQYVAPLTPSLPCSGPIGPPALFCGCLQGQRWIFEVLTLISSVARYLPSVFCCNESRCGG